MRLGELVLIDQTLEDSFRVALTGDSVWSGGGVGHFFPLLPEGDVGTLLGQAEGPGVHPTDNHGTVDLPLRWM